MAESEAELLDISSLLDRIEAQLRSSAEAESTADSLALLRSWGWNSMLNEACQRRARDLLARFDPSH